MSTQYSSMLPAAPAGEPSSPASGSAKLLITFVVVSHNSAALASQCVASIAAAMDVGPSFLPYEIIVVETGEASIEGLDPRWNAFKVAENRGYGHASNCGAARGRGKFLVILNADTEVLCFPFAEVQRRFAEHPLVAVLAPAIIEGGRVINSLRPLPSVWRDFLGELGVTDQRSRLVAHSGRFDGWAGGMALIFRTAAFRAIGGFDEDFFLYYEDTDLGARLAGCGFQQIYFPDVRIRHASGGCSDGLGWRKTLLRYESKFRYSMKHFRRERFTAHVLLTLLALTAKLAVGWVRKAPGFPAYTRALKLYATWGLICLFSIPSADRCPLSCRPAAGAKKDP